MRHLHTIACAAALALSGQAGLANAQAADQAADRLTNSVALEWEESRLRQWLNGLAAGIAVGIALADDEISACVSGWYYGDEPQNYANVRANMERFPDHTPAVVMTALARRECPALDDLRD